MSKETQTTVANAAPAALALATGSAAVLWSQDFASDYYHAIPADGHDPRASGWVALCGAFCCGEPFRAEDESGREACPKCTMTRCLHLQPNTQGDQRRGENDKPSTA